MKMAEDYIFNIKQNSDVEFELVFYTDTSQSTTEDLSGYNFKQQIKTDKNSISPVDELTNANGRIDVTEADVGKIILKFPSTVSIEYDFEEAFTDLLAINIANPDLKSRKLEGKIIVDRGVTK